MAPPCANGHVWTPLHPQWTADVSSACDCGETTFGDEQRRLMEVAVASKATVAAQRARWDITRGSAFKCQRCDTVIGTGEPYRLITTADLKYCAPCAKHTTGEEPPADLPVRRIADQLKVPDAITNRVPPALPFASASEMALRTPLDDIAAQARVQSRMLGERFDE